MGLLGQVAHVPDGCEKHAQVHRRDQFADHAAGLLARVAVDVVFTSIVLKLAS